MVLRKTRTLFEADEGVIVAVNPVSIKEVEAVLTVDVKEE
jgi:hypothetical protein